MTPAMVSARGTQRRIQALCIRGWSLSAQGEAIGTDKKAVWRVLNVDMVSAEKAAEFARLYEQLWNRQPVSTTPTEASAIRRTIEFAKRSKWVPPLAWDDIDKDVAPPEPDKEVTVDEVAVELATMGVHVRLTPAERRAAITILHGRKFSDRLIAATVGCRERSVWRIRHELGLPAFEHADLEWNHAS
jgi:hypothetical protein